MSGLGQDSLVRGLMRRIRDGEDDGIVHLRAAQSGRRWPVTEIGEEAARAANAAITSDTVRGDLVFATDELVSFVVGWSHDAAPAVAIWAEALTESLVKSGMTGTMSATMRGIPAMYTMGIVAPGTRYPAAWVGYHNDPDARRGPADKGWGLDLATARQILSRLAQINDDTIRDGPVWLSSVGEGLEVPRQAAAEAVARVAQITSGAVSYYGQTPPTGRTLTLARGGELTLSSGPCSRGRQAQAEEMTAVLLVAPERADVGFVKGAFMTATSLEELTIHPQPQAPPNEYSAYYRHRDLWRHHVLDAHGINLLTTGHLDRTASLADWITRQVGDHRYLVQARDLGPWFADAYDPEVVERARSDFGDAILAPHHY